MLVIRNALTRALVAAPLSLAACESTSSDPSAAMKHAAAAPEVADASPQRAGAEPEPIPEMLSLANEPPRPPQSSIEVELPPSPDLETPEVPRRYEDGALSVYGLREGFDDQIASGERGEDVVLRAYVQEIYIPPTCPYGQVCASAKHPHVWVADREGSKGKRTALLVAGFQFTIPEWERDRWRDQPRVVLERGEQYTIKGKFKRFTDLGFGDERGLLEFVAYKVDGEWVYPPGAYWHPINLALEAEMNAALREHAKATGAD